MLHFVSGACHITLTFPSFGNKQGVCINEQRESQKNLIFPMRMKGGKHIAYICLYD